MKSWPFDSVESFHPLRRRTRRCADRIDQLIRDRTGRDVAGFVSNCSGFPRKTRGHRISSLSGLLIHTCTRLFPLSQKLQGEIEVRAAEMRGWPLEMFRISY